jgi:sortase A
MNRRRLAAFGLLFLGALLLVQGAWIPAKAQVAQWLLRAAWNATLQDGRPHRPWPWADHWPLARLRVPRLGIEQIVLAGDSGPVLAFAPGLALAGGRPGQGRSVVLSGHRDTHFRFLADLREGDRLILETATGRQSYQVGERLVADSRQQRIAVREGVEELVLVTCYPFDAPVAGGPLRYLVRASGAG